jgi:competence protein ComEC
LLLLWIYVQATGAPPSAVRAWIMIAFLRAGQELKWPGNAISAIAASALVVLLIDPFQFFGASFQMSYAVVASL